MTTLDIVNRSCQGLHIMDHLLHLFKLMLMFYRIYRTGQSLDIQQILQDVIKTVVSVNVIDRICQICQICQRLFHIPECMLSLFNIVVWTLKTFERFHPLLYFIIMMGILYPFSHWVGQFFESINLFGNLIIMMFSIDGEYREIECLQISHVFIDLVEVMSTVHTVYRTHKLLEIV